jgi:UDP-N-acetylglucosamine acyltransferase
MTQNIHPTAIIDPQAQLADGVKVGAYSVIGANVVLGGIPQDKKYAGEPTELVIGDRNTIREFSSVHTGTVQDEGVTRIGDDNWIMGYVHIAHDCQIGNQTILANNVQLAGHVHVQDWAIVGGMTGVHQFIKIGAHAMVGGGSALHKDVLPYVTISGNPSAAYGINSEGLKRRGYSPEQISAIKRAYKMVFRQDLTIEQAIEAMEQAMQEDTANASAMRLMSDFLRTAERGIVR